MSDLQIAIIGGGPAGATFARLLDRHFSVLLIDGKTGSEESFRKVCGGLLSPDAQKAFAEFDLTLPKDIMVDPQIFSVRTIDLQNNSERHYQRFYMNLDRHKFDLWLESLVPPTVTRFFGRCKSVSARDGSYRLVCRGNDGTEKIFTADIIVGADGAGSIVRKFLYPQKKIRRYTAIQQWFPEKHAKPFYSCIFDPKTSDCCSWSISKDSFFILGGAFAPKNCRKAFEEQKKRLAEYGFEFSTPVKTEACIVLRPKSPFDICTGRGNAFLIGEAAGLISPSSLEGISFAINSARLLAETLNSGTAEPCKNNACKKYAAKILPLKLKILIKIMKCPFMYDPTLRKLVMKSGISSINVRERS